MLKKPESFTPFSNTCSKTPVLLVQFANGNLRSSGKSKLKFSLFKKPAKDNRILSSDLTIAFGSKTQMKKVNTNMKYASTIENSDSMDNLLNTISETSLEQKNYSENNASSAIPPQNSSASNVDEVYNLEDVVSKEELDMLDSEAQVFLLAKQDTIQQWKKENKYPDIIIQYLENNHMFMNIQKAKLLCYLNYMFSFLKTTYQDWKRKDPVPSVPQPFKQKLIESFTMNKSFPMRLKEKLLAYATVLALKLNNYILSCNDLASSTKIPITRITSVAYALGCHVSESRKNGIKTIQLKLPLYKMKSLPNKKKKM